MREYCANNSISKSGKFIPADLIQQNIGSLWSDRFGDDWEIHGAIAPGEVYKYYDIVILGKIKRSLLQRFYVPDA
ncbi:MAG: hypothetical protein V7K83_03480 [Nostoc sp.]